jgi:GntR family transcriptional regulator of vanillate catabolism
MAATATITDNATSQTMRAQLRLRELILSGEFRHGDRVSELPLVERIGVSRTPLRLALVKLEHEGLLQELPGGGYVVREFTSSDIAQANELRGVLEGTAARYAAERGTSRRALRALQRVSDEIAEVVHEADYESFERYVGLNGRFHAELVRLGGSRILERALDMVTCVPFASATSFVVTEAELPASREVLVVAHNQHLTLIEAIASREGARAESIAREHAMLALQNLQIVLRHRGVIERVPGHALTTLDQDG